MRRPLRKVLVTGAAGFIGSAFVRLGLKENKKIVVVDKLTYAADLKRLEVRGKRYRFYKADILDKAKINKIIAKEKPEVIVNFAAETHVDRSILDARPFIETNVIGTQVLLEAARRQKIKKFVHISTDEVYGEIGQGKFLEDSPFCPNSPYSATKAAADLLIKAYIRTYCFPALIVRPCNNYGPWQYPEKLIPLSILKILRQEKIPIYAKGKNVREWLYVDDCAQAIWKIAEKGKMGEVYNLGSNDEKQNIEVARTILKVLRAPGTQIKFVKDRPGHDIRYRLDSSKLYHELKWKPKVKFQEGIKRTVLWAIIHKDWLLSKWAKVAPLYK